MEVVVAVVEDEMHVDMAVELLDMEVEVVALEVSLDMKEVVGEVMAVGEHKTVILVVVMVEMVVHIVVEMHMQEDMEVVVELGMVKAVATILESTSPT
ncbi:hypothetical protein V6N13_133931 [Hibiscus sabdariffa]|uniref:Uncharacterized protein n=1 Tax=Hibiscus sabdariffa TaxID=183260 RepID=A0ABR2R078_9ROSI